VSPSRSKLPSRGLRQLGETLTQVIHPRAERAVGQEIDLFLREVDGSFNPQSQI
jgi:hypothetical protein